MKQIVKHQEPPYFKKWKEDFQKAVGKEPEYKDFSMYRGIKFQDSVDL